MENSVVSLTGDHLENKAADNVIGRKQREMRPMHELLRKTNLRIMAV